MVKNNSLIFIVLALLFACNKKVEQKKQKNSVVKKDTLIKVANKYKSPILEDVDINGVIGNELDKIIDKRITSKFAVDSIVPEATKAFEIRMDDRYYDNWGLWQGEFWGKWVLSAVEAYRYTGDESIKNTIKKETERLIKTQDPNGYIGSYTKSDLVKGNVWNVWNRKYVLWGLVDAYEILKDPKILKAAEKMTKHLMTEVGPDAVSIVDTGNFYGLPSSSILTPLVKLYRYTTNKEYLDYALYIVNDWAKDPNSPPNTVNKGLTGEPVHMWYTKKGKWTKAYEFISTVEGLLDLYQITGNKDYFKAAKNIYDVIRKHERVITGGIGYHDKLLGKADQPEGLSEPCDVVYWERLSAKLLKLTGDQKYADEIEKLTYNILMASFNEQGDWAVRRLGLNEPHLVAPLHAFTNYHQCCVANVPRGFLQLGEVAVLSDTATNELLINLFIDGKYELQTSDKENVSVDIETKYPENGLVNIVLNTSKPFDGVIKIRKPQWLKETSSSSTKATVSGSNSITANDNQDAWVLSGKWKNGDKIEINMNMEVVLKELPNRSDYKAFMWGPVVLSRSSMFEENLNNDIPLNLLNYKAVKRNKNAENTKSWMQFDLLLSDGKKIILCDYASTGKNYEKPKDPKAWDEMIKNRVDEKHQVWVKNE